MVENFAKVVKPASKEAELLAKIDFARLPQHIAVIMDGNGRWAKQRGKPRIFGHRAGAESVRAILDTCARLQIEAVTLYAFSTENWKRPEDEVSGLMQMLKLYLKKELKTVHGNNIKFQAIGKIEGLGEDLQKQIAAAMKYTEKNTGTVLSVALNYGGRAEIVDAATRFAGGTEEDFAKLLYAPEMHDPDIVIRTSGEQRLSNYLLWQSAYSELVFADELWPDFSREAFRRALDEYDGRARRFGGR